MKKRLKSIPSARFLSALFIFFLFILMIATYDHYGIAWDENRFVSTGKYYFIKLFDIVGLETNLSDDSQKYYYFELAKHVASHGVIFDIATVGLTLLFKTVRYETFHLIRGVLALPTFALLAYVVSRVTNPWHGLFAMILLATTPRFWGNIFVSPIDIPTSLFFIVVVASFMIYLKSDRSFKKSLLLGLPIGIAVVQRLLLGYIVVVSILTLFAYEILSKKRRWRKLTIETITIGISSLIIMHLAHPFLLTHPITGLARMIDLNVNFAVFNADVLFEGVSIHASRLPWYYLPKYVVITTPVITLILFLLGFVFMTWSLFKKNVDIKTKTIYIYFVLLLLSPVIINAVVRPILYDSWRMFLFLTIPMTIIATFGFFKLTQKFSRRVTLLTIVVIGASIISVVYEMWQLHPYEYVYFNSLVGGLKGADGQYETDYWALGNKEAIEWFNENVYQEGESYTLMTEGDPFSSNYYFKENMYQTVDFTQADYHISFTRWNKHLSQSGEIIHTVSRKDVPLVYIRKLR